MVYFAVQTRQEALCFKTNLPEDYLCRKEVANDLNALQGYNGTVFRPYKDGSWMLCRASTLTDANIDKRTIPLIVACVVTKDETERLFCGDALFRLHCFLEKIDYRMAVDVEKKPPIPLKQILQRFERCPEKQHEEVEPELLKAFILCLGEAAFANAFVVLPTRSDSLIWDILHALPPVLRQFSFSSPMPLWDGKAALVESVNLLPSEKLCQLSSEIGGLPMRKQINLSLDKPVLSSFSKKSRHLCSLVRNHWERVWELRTEDIPNLSALLDHLDGLEQQTRAKAKAKPETKPKDMFSSVPVFSLRKRFCFAGGVVALLVAALLLWDGASVLHTISTLIVNVRVNPVTPLVVLLTALGAVLLTSGFFLKKELR